MRKIRETKVGATTLRLFEENRLYRGVAVVGSTMHREEGQDADDVWRRLHDRANRANPHYFGFDGARARFLKFFPDGFHSELFLKEERGYKLKAKAELDVAAPLEAAFAGSGFGEAVLAVYRGTNLLSPYEKIRVQDVLRGPNADAFIRAAARFSLSERKPALLDMERALKPHDSAKWTVVTYLPFLWRPDTHMFLKPEVTKDFAARVGHRFASDYQPRLDIAVYESLLDLAARTKMELLDLNPRDGIDIQSFIWIVGAYEERQEDVQAEIATGAVRRSR